MNKRPYEPEDAGLHTPASKSQNGPILPARVTVTLHVHSDDTWKECYLPEEGMPCYYTSKGFCTNFKFDPDDPYYVYGFMGLIMSVDRNGLGGPNHDALSLARGGQAIMFNNGASDLPQGETFTLMIPTAFSALTRNEIPMSDDEVTNLMKDYCKLLGHRGKKDHAKDGAYPAAPIPKSNLIIDGILVDTLKNSWYGVKADGETPDPVLLESHASAKGKLTDINGELGTDISNLLKTSQTYSIRDFCTGLRHLVNEIAKVTGGGDQIGNTHQTTEKFENWMKEFSKNKVFLAALKTIIISNGHFTKMFPTLFPPLTIASDELGAVQFL